MLPFAALLEKPMILYKQKDDIQKRINSLKDEGKSIGFVPTMGALHEGHLSLIEASRKANDVTVCSIFVNPTQFNDPKDFEKYPVTIESDIAKLTEAGTDILFLPSVNEMYPGGTQTLQHYELGDLETILEGKFRPGHYQGVCNVVYRLFNIVKPHKAFFGQKDYQQCMVIQKLVELENLPIEIVVHQTVREDNGLAMSSRNLRLSDKEREKATAIYKSLLFIKENNKKFPVSELVEKATQMIVFAGFEKTDYVSICDATTLHPLEEIIEDTNAIALVAAFLQDVRLIDNMLL